jgi:hypothetical protein
MGRLIWVASYPKSGNTWLRLFLYAYLQLEHQNLERIDLNAPEFTAMTSSDVARAWFEPLLPAPWEQSTGQHAAAVRAQVQQNMADAVTGFGLVKTHGPYGEYYGIPNIFAEVTAGAYYIIRNPLDVALSLRNHHGLSNYTKAIQILNKKNRVQLREDKFIEAPIGSWRQNVEGWASLSRRGIHVMRYEDMLENPEEVFGRAVRQMGQPEDPDRVRRAIELTSFDQLAAAEAKTGFDEKPKGASAFFHSGKAGRWESELSPGQIRAVVAENHDLMRKFGYMTERLEQFVPKPKKKRK